VRLAPLGAFTEVVQLLRKGDQQALASTGAFGAQRAGHYMQPTNLKAIARDATLRGDTQTLFHTLDLLERVVPVATFVPKPPADR
jgi:hypothetical protein